MTTSPKTPALWKLIFICSIAAFCALLPADAIPAIAAFFHASTDHAEQVITWYLLGYGLGPLLYAPLSNRFGRKPALLTGLGIAGVGMLLSLAALSSHLLWLMTLGRLIAGIGASAGLTLGMVILKETASTEQARKMYSYIVVIFAFAPAIALAIGGTLTQYIGITAIFILMPILTLLLAMVVLTIDESYQDKPVPLRINAIANSYLSVLKQPIVMLLVLIFSMAGAAMYVFNGISPLIAINQLHISASLYGNLAIIPSMGIFLGGMISSQLSTRWKARSSTRLGLLLMFIGSALMTLAFMIQGPTLINLLIPTMITFTGAAIVIPNTSMTALSIANDPAATASVLSALGLIFSSAALAVAGHTLHISTMTLPITLIVLSIIAAALLPLTRRHVDNESTADS